MRKKNKYVFKLILFQIVLIFSLCSTNNFVLAEKTDAGIGFEESTVTTAGSSSSETPTILKPVDPNIDAKLPHLGQMISSIILMLFGLGILVIFVGIFALKKLCYKNLREV